MIQLECRNGPGHAQGSSLSVAKHRSAIAVPTPGPTARPECFACLQYFSYSESVCMHMCILSIIKFQLLEFDIHWRKQHLKTPDRDHDGWWCQSVNQNPLVAKIATRAFIPARISQRDPAAMIITA